MRDSKFLFGAVIMLSCALLATIALVVFVGKSALDNATSAVDQSVRATQLSQAIQQERKTNILVSCRAQNARHDATVKALDRLLTAAQRRYPKRRAQIQTSRASTLLLIDALAPKQNCRRLVVRQTSRP